MENANVALIVETSSVYGRRILRGISRYLHTHGGWSVFLDERERRAPPPQWLLDWEGDGIICRSTTPELARALQERDIAVVDLNDHFGYLGLPYISSDMQAIGAMATRHLLERGFERIAFCGFDNELWSKTRLQGVERTLAEQGQKGQLCSVFESHSDFRAQNWQEERRQMFQWIQSLSYPVGIVCCNDLRGQHVLDACRVVGVAVPDEVAVVGVDDTILLCELCEPSLSSVATDSEQIGWEAAALLARLMEQMEQKSPHVSRGEGPDEAPSLPPRVTLPPIEVVLRRSSDVWAVSDPATARAVRLIHERACAGLSVDEVAAHVYLSRSTLERRFRQHLSHSPQEEIRSARLKRVKHLLRETDLPLARIAELAGFEHPEYMMVQFKRVFGQTPSQWRAAQST